MNVPSLDKTLKTSLSHQLKQSILDAILSGTLKHNSPLPYEEDIADFYHVSRSIVRKAYDELESLGYITRIKRLGTRVRVLPTYYIPFSEIIRFPFIKTTTSTDIVSLDSRLVLKEVIRHKHIPEEVNGENPHWLRLATLYQCENHPFIFCDGFYPHTLSNHLLHQMSIFQIREYLQTHSSLSDLSISFDYRVEKPSSFILTTLNLSNNSVIFHFNLKIVNSKNECICLMQLYADASSLIFIDEGI